MKIENRAAIASGSMVTELYQVDDEVFLKAVLGSKGHATGLALELLLLEIGNCKNE